MSDLVGALKENTEAIRALTAALIASGAIPADVTVNVTPAIPVHPPKAEAAIAAALSPLDYERDVKPVGLKLAAKNKQQLTNLLQEFGVTKGTELKPGQFAEFIQLAQRLVADE